MASALLVMFFALKNLLLYFVSICSVVCMYSIFAFTIIILKICLLVSVCLNVH